MTGIKRQIREKMIQKDIRIVKGFGVVCSGQRNFIIDYYEWQEIQCDSFGQSFTSPIRTELQ